ncbi:hypothetical protein GCM10025770_12480 [Viridibacterium curvum]|uniref:HPP family protein n=1 Tax=Viridibacterium curvum TaxID=1101404 RepID=A0ABP9QI16_9RHOO
MKFFPPSELAPVPMKEGVKSSGKHAALGACIGLLVSIVMIYFGASVWWFIAFPAGAFIGATITSGGRPPVMW